MSSDGLLWTISGMSRNEWNETKHCYCEKCHIAITARQGGTPICGPHCEPRWFE
jgi:hypothetical protein